MSSSRSKLNAALYGVLGAALYSLCALAISVYVFESYGWSLFIATPILMGAISSFTLNHRQPASISASMSAAGLSILLAGMLLLLFALEGAICLAMALPPAWAFALVGAYLGREAARHVSQPSPKVLSVLLLVPLLSSVEAPLGLVDAPRMRYARTSVVVNAPPEKVWPRVIAFPELPTTQDLVFMAGVAHPLRARIDGEGINAIRYCEFSTGPFVEPITAWDAPHHLAFDVTEQPPTMEEWSPYHHIEPPHLKKGFLSHRGEFRLIPLEGGKTRLEGTTWYTVNLGPEAYWALWADWLIHKIHGDVLSHIASVVEAESASR